MMLWKVTFSDMQPDSWLWFIGNYGTTFADVHRQAMDYDCKRSVVRIERGGEISNASQWKLLDSKKVTDCLQEMGLDE